MPILAVLPDGPVDPPNTDDGWPRIIATWAPPVGDPIILTACPTGLDWGQDRGGEDLPPFEWVEDENPVGDGSTLRGVRATPRTLNLPLILKADNFGDWRPLHQRFAEAMNPLDGDGVLTYAMPDGTSRQLFARYHDGAEGDKIRDYRGLWYRLYGIQLRAVDPWWYSPSPEVVTWSLGDSNRLFFPIFPVHLSSSRVLGNATFDLAGNVRTWGIWTITGPANGLAVLSSLTTGRSVRLNLSGAYQLGAGQTVTVDMRPNRQSIIGPGGLTDNWYPARSGLPRFFSLEKGTNQLSLSVAGADVGTTVTLAYQPRWLTA